MTTDESGMRPVVRNSVGQNGSRRSPAQPHPPVLPVKLEGAGKAGFGITFVHLGRKYYHMTLWAATHANHRKWIENITRQQDLMRERSQFFETEMLSESFFQAMNHATCAAPFSESYLSVFGSSCSRGTWCRWRTESRVRYIRRRIFSGFARAE